MKSKFGKKEKFEKKEKKMENIQENIASAAQNTEFSETSSENKCEILPNINVNYQKLAPLEDEKNNGKDDKI